MAIERDKLELEGTDICDTIKCVEKLSILELTQILAQFANTIVQNNKQWRENSNFIILL